MTLNELALLPLAIVALLVSLYWVRRIRVAGLEKAWLTTELQDAELVYSEQVFRTRSPVSIVAKLDRGYQNVEGVIILVELKTRSVNRPYFSDVIELSAQRLAVQAQTRKCVADHAYVLIQQNGIRRKTAHRVALLSRAEVVALATRREAILMGEVVPQYACSEGLCDRCAFKQACQRSVDLFP